MVALNLEVIEKLPEIITKIKPFRNKYKWEVTIFPSEGGDCKQFEKNNVTIPLKVLYAKMEKYILLMFENITDIVKNKLFFLKNGITLAFF